MPKLSVTIPIYNVEKYIERCARSLFEQTLEDIEFIFVNDCTPDQSMQILREVLTEYPARIPCVKIVEHDVNYGLSTTRNTGIDAASGEYIICCDSDDWVEPEMYQTLYNKAIEDDADIVGMDFYVERKDGTHYCSQLFPKNVKDCIHYSLQGRLQCVLWNKLVKRELYVKYKIREPDGINMWEDVATIIQLYFFSKKITYLPVAYYHYNRTNEQSYMNTNAKNQRTAPDMLAVMNILESFFYEEGVLSDFENSLNYMRLSVKLYLLKFSVGDKQKEWNSLWQSANKQIFLCTHIPLVWRIALWLASMKMLPLFNCVKGVRNQLKNSR